MTAPDTTPAVRIVPGRGHTHTALMDLIHSDLMRQFPGSLVEEDGNASIAIHSPKPYLTIDVSALAEAALAAAPVAPAGEGEELDLYDDKVQAGMAWTMRQWGETLGLTTWTQGDGSESVEGDVGAEIHTILVDAGLRDPETNEMAALRARSSPDLSGGGERREACIEAILSFHAATDWPTQDAEDLAVSILAALSPSREGVEPEAGAVAWFNPQELRLYLGKRAIQLRSAQDDYATDALYAHPTPADDRLAVAVKALEFYAQPIWSISGKFPETSPHSEYRPDCGDTARQAIALLTKSGEAEG